MLNSNTYFSKAPNIDIQRSTFDRSCNVKTTFNAGKLVPIFIDEVLPGDTYTMDTAMLCRMTTPVFPVMDTAYIDYYWFYVPQRLTWEHSKEFFGENTQSAWVPTTTYQIPQVYMSGDTHGKVSDYFGIATDFDTSQAGINALPFRAYRLVWNEWFRDENVENPVLISKGEVTTESDWNELLPVNRLHDYFSSCLPAPQKGDSVKIPFSSSSTLAVNTYSSDLVTGTQNSLKFYNINGTYPTGGKGAAFGNDRRLGVENDTTFNSISNGVYPSNLGVAADDLTNNATINALRQAFAV